MTEIGVPAGIKPGLRKTFPDAMRRDYCDRCQEVILDHKYVTGAKREVTDEDMPHIPWIVEIKISSARPFWRLCALCAKNVISEAILGREENRV